MLTVSVRSLPSEASTTHGQTKAVAVIDVLRATTVMATALHNGANAIIATADIDEALRLRAERVPDALLCGERNGSRIPGFDLGNSPYEFGAQVVAGKTLIMCTTNGTRAIESAGAPDLLVALSFANLSAAASILLQAGLPVELLCSGTNGRFSLDDALCAGMTLAWLSAQTTVQTDDLGKMLLQFARQEGSIAGKLNECVHKRFLENSGYERDLAFCFSLDQFDTVPVLSAEGYFVAAR